MSKRVLVTGGAGFIGSHIVDLLIENKYRVFIMDNMSTGKDENINQSVFAINRESVDNFSEVRRMMDSFRPQVILHLAAQPSLLNSEREPQHDAQTNILGTINLLYYLKYYTIEKFIFASTSAVYDNSVNYMNENMIKYGQPGSPYGISKLAAEHYINLLMPNHVIFRLANVYGERQIPIGKNQLIPHAIKHIVYGDEFNVMSPKSTRDYIYVKDVAKAFLQAVESDITGTFNLSTGKSTEVMTILDSLKEVSGWDGEWQVNEVKDSRPYVHMENEKFKKVFGMSRFTSLEKGLERTFQWWKENASI